MKKISIILITWNSELYLTDCLNSVLENTKDMDKEIIIVDNGSTDNTVKLIKSYLPSNVIYFISNNKNEGVAKARNIGIKQAIGKYIWLLDIDTIINKESILAMINFMDKNAECGICGCKLINSRGQVQDSCRKYPTFKYKLNNVLVILFSKMPFLSALKRKLETKNGSQYYRSEIQKSEPFQVEYLIGACQLIRREVIEQIGVLDEQIFYGPEDADYCLRAYQKGWRIYYLPQISFIHEYQQLTGKRIFSRISLLHILALIYFFRKHKL